MALSSLPSVPGLSVATPVEASTPRVATLERLRQKIKSREKPDKARLLAFYHQGLDETVYIGAMSSQGYEAVENVAVFAPPGTPLAGQKISDNQQDAINSDLAYLMHGMWLEGDVDGELRHLERDDAWSLRAAKECGPSNRALINAIKDLNPPRDYLRRELQTSLAIGRANTLLFRLAMDLGLGESLLNYLAPSSTEEEKAQAATKLKKVEEVMMEIEAYVDIAQVARNFGIDLKERNA